MKTVKRSTMKTKPMLKTMKKDGNKPLINSMTASCGNFLKKRDKRVRQEHSDLYYCTKCFYFSLKCTKIVSSWGSAPYRPRWGAYIRSCMVLRKGGEGEVKEMRF